jgi:O-acetyl-ADP-ribose deacetylase
MRSGPAGSVSGQLRGVARPFTMVGGLGAEGGGGLSIVTGGPGGRGGHPQGDRCLGDKSDTLCRFCHPNIDHRLPGVRHVPGQCPQPCSAALLGGPRRRLTGLTAHRLKGATPASSYSEVMAAQITVVRGDITEQRVDAVVNAANSSLLGGGGVDGAIHRRGGPAILAECRQLRAGRYPSGLPTGHAVATSAGDLPARWVIHTVGPVHSESEDRAELLASCYRESLRIADELGAQTVAFPAVSTGVYGWPLHDAARIALTTVRNTPTGVREARFVLFSIAALDTFRTVCDSTE